MTDEPGIPENDPVIEAAPLRENLITTAVKFLQNPKVQSSPLSQKKDFLKRKGIISNQFTKLSMFVLTNTHMQV